MDKMVPLYQSQRLLVPSTVVVMMVLALALCWLRRDRRLDSIPGPKLNPFVGVGFKLPPRAADLFRQWAGEYGDVFKIRVGLYDWVVLDSPEAVITSSKSPAPIGGDVVAAGKRMPNMPYGPMWRAQRAAVRVALTVPMVTSVVPVQEFEAKQLLHDLAHNNANQREFYQHIRRYSLSIVYTNAFGERIKSWDHPEARSSVRAQTILREAFKPGAYVVDDLPPLAALPKWLQPGRREAEKTAAELKALRMDRWEDLVRKVEAGTMPECAARSMYENRQHWYDQGLTDEDLAWVGAGLIEAGFETTAATFNNLVLQLAAHPECQEAAHAELDRIVGPDRLPVFADLPNLPYVRACVKEMLRINPILTPGIRHYADQDVTYRGHVIPRGTVLVANTAFLHRDPARYKQPDEFRPERFIGWDLYSADYVALGDASRRDHFAFSSGRRVCAGAGLAENSLCIGLAAVLWAFTIRPPVDERDGTTERPMETGSGDYVDNCFLIPLPFAARFLIRSPGRLRVLEDAWKTAEREGYELRGMPVDVDGVQKL